MKARMCRTPERYLGRRRCNYSDDFGPVTLTAYGGAAEGRGEHKLPGQEGVSDLGAGLRADYTVNDDLTLSLGGA